MTLFVRRSPDGVLLDGRYQVRDRIAGGGMATVYRATDLRLHRDVAVKVMHPAYSADSTFVARFANEARSIARLSDPNVVTVYDHGSHGDLAYLVMELVDGQTLRRLLTASGRLTVPEAAGTMAQLLSGLAAAHRIGLVHRDVKPENVLIRADGTVKIADFGLSRLAHSATGTGGVLGTATYLAPEVIEGRPVDARADVYAAGIVLYELLTGSVPFHGPTPTATAYDHVCHDVPPPSWKVDGVPPALDRLVVRATRRDIAQRPVDASAFLRQLRTATSDTTSGGVPSEPLAEEADEGITEPIGRDTLVLPATARTSAVRRSRRAARVIALVLAGLLTAVTGWSLTHRTTHTPSVVGLSDHRAVARLHAAGLRAHHGAAVFDERHPAGVVVRQRPAAGTAVARHGSVVLILSKGTPRVRMPDLVGKSRAAAVRAVHQAGLRATMVEVDDSDVPAGTVVTTSPAAGASLTRGTTVHVYVSRTPSSALCRPLIRRWLPVIAQPRCRP